MKKIQSNMKTLECLQAYMLFFRRSRAANSAVSGGIPPKFKLIQAFMVALITCKNEDPIKTEGTRVLTRFLHYKSMDFFSQILKSS